MVAAVSGQYNSPVSPSIYSNNLAVFNAALARNTNPKQYFSSPIAVGATPIASNYIRTTPNANLAGQPQTDTFTSTTAAQGQNRGRALPIS